MVARPVVAGVGISHPERVVYPSPRLTKLDIARYYETMQEWIVPHVRGRPLTVVRCPEGIDGACFFMKHSQVWAPSGLRRVRIQEKTKVGEYLIADEIDGIVGLAQMGVLEIHTWNSTFDTLEYPNRIVFDLDPGRDVGWPRVIAAAKMFRKLLESLELESWVKTTGGRGLHVVVPLAPHASWSECLEFSRALSARAVTAHPAEYTIDFGKAGRENKILLDYLRNNRTNTSVAAYSTRARPGAPVSMPIGWEELRPGLKPESFSVKTVPTRVRRRRADPWRPYWLCRQRLTRQRLRAVTHQ